jgi:hypothetical protein
MEEPEPVPPDAAAPTATSAAPSMIATLLPPPPSASSAPPSSTFADPGCPEVPPPAQVNDCNPFIIDSTGEMSDPLAPGAPPESSFACQQGEACIPFVDYPNAPCEPETFGTKCVPAGTAGQGMPCDEGCAAGFLCVATGLGTRCAQLCPLPGENACPSGLLCGAVDIEGYGVCF